MLSWRSKMILTCVFFSVLFAPGSPLSERVRLQDIQALTLHAGRMTTGRRTPPVAQLKCIKGCHAPQPRVVQCINAGWDGSSVQWECKTQLESQYQLGEIEVVCEGYDYADDPYILKGSCGLEYAIENRPGYTEGSNRNSYGWKEDLDGKQEKSSTFGDLLFFVGCCIVIYGLYKTCLAPSMEDPHSQQSPTDNDHPDDGMGPNGRPNMGWNVPGRGMGGLGSDFSGPDYMPGCGPGRRRRRSFWSNMGMGGGGGGFWTGLATGGMMGYMFGGNNRNSGGNFARPRRDFGGSSGLFSSGQAASSSTSESTSFGGTRRR